MGDNPENSPVNSGYVPKNSSKFIKNNPKNMLSTIATILIILWLLGVVTSYTLGGFIHVLFVIALIIILIRLINGERVL